MRLHRVLIFTIRNRLKGLSITSAVQLVSDLRKDRLSHAHACCITVSSSMRYLADVELAHSVEITYGFRKFRGHYTLADKGLVANFMATGHRARALWATVLSE